MATRKKSKKQVSQSRSDAAKRGWETRKRRERLGLKPLNQRPKIKVKRPSRRELEARLRKAEEKLEQLRIKREIESYKSRLRSNPTLVEDHIRARLIEAQNDPYDPKNRVREAVQILHFEMMEWDLEPYADDIGEIWEIYREGA